LEYSKPLTATKSQYIVLEDGAGEENSAYN